MRIIPEITSEIEARFWNKVDKNGPVPAHVPELGQCWIWAGAKLKSGYGQFNINKTPHLAHRISWAIKNGPITNERPFVLHKCDNSSCCRPEHLFDGTQKMNIHDAIKKSRNSMPPRNDLKGEKHGRVKLKNHQVAEIRDRYSAGGVSQESLGKIYGVTQTAIGQIVRRKHWAHI